MQNRKILLFLLIIALIGCNVLIFINLNKKNELISVCADNLYKSNQKITSRLNYFLEREYKCFESENFPLSGQLILKGLDGNSCLLKEKLNQSSTLFFRYSASNCQTCIDIEVQRMVKYLNNVNPDKIIILVSDKDIKDLNYFRKVNGIDFEIFLVEKDQVSIPMEKYNIPYLFILTPDGFTNSVFVPEKNENRFSEQYYNVIKKII